jgi:FAD/FMN-containing dehydrogenase
LTAAAIEALGAHFDGAVVRQGDEDYATARAIWNGHIDLQPALIARCSGPADVVTAVRVARDHDIDASVRGGGHAVAGYALCEGGMVIDLSMMTGARVDPRSSTIRVQGGCLNSHFDREAQAFGLAATSGFVSHTGVAGLTLGGGIGHLMRKFGLTIDSLRSCDVVTAEAATVVASAEENPDLFWGLRGGGGNFGVVTSFEFQLYPLGPMVLAGMVMWPMDDAVAVLGLLRELAAEGPDELCIMANLRLAPLLPAIPEELHGQPIVALIVCYAGPVDDGENVLRQVREFGNAVLDTVMPKPYAAHQKLLDAAVPHGQHYYWKSHKLPALSDEMISLIVEHASMITSGQSSIPVFTQGGAVARVPDDATAFAHRDASHDINIVGSWAPDDADPERHIEWVRSFYSALEPHSAGLYVNFVSDDAVQHVREAAYGTEKWNQLVELKARYDPSNFFRHNANIPPTG